MRKNRNIPVFFAVDDNYVPLLATALRSIISNSSAKNNYDINIITEKISAQNKLTIESMQTSNVSIRFVDVGDRMAAICERLHIRDYYTNTTYYRFFIPEMFPEYDKGIYLDCDIVVTRDLAKMFKHKLGKKLAAVITDEIITDIDIFANYSETVLNIPRKQYFNAGIMLMNLHAMRKMHIEQEFTRLLDVRAYRVAQDQDYLNVICNGNLKYLNKTWNKTPLPSSDPKKIPAIIHFKINFKPWRYDGIPYAEYFWKYAEQTPFFDSLSEIKANYTKEEMDRDTMQYEGLMALAKEEIQNEIHLREVSREIDLISFDHLFDNIEEGLSVSKQDFALSGSLEAV